MRNFRVQRERYIFDRAKDARTVLHLGCSNSPHTKRLWVDGELLHRSLCESLPDSQRRIVGLDADAEAIAWLSEKLPSHRLVAGDAHDLAATFPNETFDLIIAGDVIEHLPNPGQFLVSCRSALEKSGSLLVTTINAFGVVRFVKGLVGHEAVHRDHTAYYSFSTLRRLGKMCGLDVRQAGYYACEPRVMRQGLNGVVSTAIETVTCAVWPQFSEGLIVELTPRDTFVEPTQFDDSPDDMHRRSAFSSPVQDRRLA